jgi:hypothetical protein
VAISARRRLASIRTWARQPPLDEKVFRTVAGTDLKFFKVVMVNSG